jgi:hypothetical protein
MVQLLDGATPCRETDAEKYLSGRLWGGLMLGHLLDRADHMHPNREGFAHVMAQTGAPTLNKQALRAGIQSKHEAGAIDCGTTRK